MDITETEKRQLVHTIFHDVVELASDIEEALRAQCFEPDKEMATTLDSYPVWVTEEVQPLIDMLKRALEIAQSKV